MNFGELVDSMFEEGFGMKRVPRPSYDMLPTWSSQRKQYEVAPPTGWQLIQVERWITEYEQTLDTLEAAGLVANDKLPVLERAVKTLEAVNKEALDVFGKASHRHAIEEAREALAKGKAARSGALKEHQRMTALKLAAEQWRDEGKSLRGRQFDGSTEKAAA
jgi:hypothetical protein